MKHKGFDADRLKPAAGNPREVAFARAWIAHNHQHHREYGCGYLVENLIPEATERDAQVAATLMQWLGSNVGMAYLRDVVRKNKQVREFLSV